MKLFRSVWMTMFLVSIFALAAFSQANPTGTLNGLVLDPSGAAIPGATVTVTDTGTARVYNLESDANGRFVLASLSPGNYDVTVSHTGFQNGAFHNVEIVVGQTYSLSAKMSLGQAGQTVEVQAGQEVIETQQSSIGNQVTGAQITQLPITSRNAQDLAVMEPGTQTGSAPRNSAFNGLPPGALNITFDGINSQDNLLKSTSTSSFFSIEQPRVDDVEEFNITQAANDASQSGEGAVQIALVSKKGTNQFHGGAWEYIRNDALNANYYFNNDSNLPRQRLRLNEFGYKLGGPILKDKLFFFVDTDFFKNPNGVLRQRAILTSSASSGNYTYTPSTMPTAAQLATDTWLSCGTTTCTANLMAMAAANNFTSTVDPTVGKFVGQEAAAATASGVSLGPQTNFNSQPLLFNANAASNTYYPDVRLDYNINQTNSLEFDYHYSYYNSNPDLLNSADASLPVAPFSTNVGAQISDRSLMALAWRSQLSHTMTNELRVGGNSSPVWFFQGQTDAIYPTISSNLGSTAYRPSFSQTLLTNPYNSFNPQGRNVGLAQIDDNLNWLHGSHSMTFGTNITGVRYKQTLSGQPVASVSLGLSSLDPAFGMFSSGNLPGMGASDLGLAEGLYGLLAGRVTSYSQTVNVDPATRKYTPGFNNLTQIGQKEMGYFFSDNWAVTPNFNFNYGLRWEWEGTPTDELNEYYVASGVGGINGLYGISGVGNLFMPGTTSGAVPTFTNDQGNQNFYVASKKDFAPSIGAAWTPSMPNGILQSIFGQHGTSVFRAGYAIAYDREGLNAFSSRIPGNPGVSNNGFLTAASSNGAAGSGLFQAGSISLGSGNLGTVGQEESLPYGSVLPINPAFGDAVNGYDPNLKPPMIQSWSVGIQRQLNPSTALEVRYVGNHGTREWIALNLNETNIVENGFLTEFNHAVSNLNICLANQAACKTAAGSSSKSTYSNFGNLGLPGQVNVPIMTSNFTGSQTGSQTNSGFVNGGFITDLQNGLAGSFANTLAGTFSDWQNMTAAGLASNLFRANPDAFGGANELTDVGQSTYNALQVELRHRMSNGLQVNANYTWSHSLGTGSIFTLRNLSAAEAPTGTDLRHAFKMENLYQLPFGAGHRLSSSSGLVNQIIGGWEWDGITRWQSGPVVALSSGLGGTFNQNDGGVNVIGMSVDDVQAQLAASKQTNSKGVGVVYYAPNSLLGTNQQRANQSFLQSCTTAGAFCGHPYVYGPSFFEADWALVRTFKLSERYSFMLRANALDAFNNINFQNPASGSLQSTSFMQITSAYQDFNSSQYPGGRTIELQGRLIF